MATDAPPALTPDPHEAGFRGIRMIPFEPGVVDVSVTAPGDMLAYNFRIEGSQLAIGSDRLRSYSVPDNSYCWLPRGADFRQLGLARAPSLLLCIESGDSGPLGGQTKGATAVDRFHEFKTDVSSARVAADAIAALMSPHQDDLRLEALALTLLERASARLGFTAPKRLSSSEPRVMQAMRFMKARLGDKLSVAAISDEVQLSAQHLNRIFRAGTGRSVWSWLMDARCREARRRLMETRDPIVDIAVATGFHDQAHLCRTVKSFLGVTPAAFRSELS